MSTGSSFGYQQPSYGSMGGMGGYNPFGGMGYGQQMGGYGQPMGGYSNPYASSYGSTYNPFGSSSYGMSYDPYMSMGFGGGYQQPSSYNPFAGGGFGTTFGGMGGYNQMGGYGQVGLGYLPPPQPTINDTVANQFMQQYYGGAFGLGAQPQPRRQRPRNPFRRDMQPLMEIQPQQDVALPLDEKQFQQFGKGPELGYGYPMQPLLNEKQFQQPGKGSYLEGGYDAFNVML